jgi:hypothetical protein
MLAPLKAVQITVKIPQLTKLILTPLGVAPRVPAGEDVGGEFMVHE